ncbi:MAG: Glycosylphosphatidylinositol (GPI) anchor assembly protein [Stictis urceolatum]|nr:Glycosylphosphatidylinositol (GPI) anchor assembly protein [Stictis urceolata]
MSSPVSSTPLKAPEQQPQSRTITPTTTPIPNYTDPLAKAYTHIHPLLVLAYYRLRFFSLVEDPVPELARQLIPLVILQSAYVVICLPPTTGSNRVGDIAKSGKGDNKAKAAKRDAKSKAPAAMGSRITTALLSLPLSLLPGTLVITILLILFGAPLTTHLPHTLLLGAHMSLLSSLPLFYSHGVDRQAWWEISAFMLPGDEVWGGTIGTVVGAWLGAVPIPLDWDREWQKWPVTICTGAYLGWAVGRAAGGWVFRGWRINFDP